MRALPLLWMSTLIVLGALARACDGERPSRPPDLLPVGTWGGENVGMLVTDSGAHVHIGCTLGDLQGRIPVGDDGRFDVAGKYVLRAYPIWIGPEHLARFAGRTDGRTLTLTVALTDTNVTLGPVQLTFGREPRMGPCPICRSPAADR